MQPTHTTLGQSVHTQGYLEVKPNVHDMCIINISPPQSISAIVSVRDIWCQPSVQSGPLAELVLNPPTPGEIPPVQLHVGLRTHNCTPVGEFIEGVPAPE